MPVATNPEWQHLAVYVVGAALVLVVLFRIPYVGQVLRALFSFGMLAACLFLLVQQAPFIPGMARVTESLGIDGQAVDGNEVRIRMSPDGHFWARVTVNGLEQRMLIDSGATITALSDRTAREASVKERASVVPMILRTANGDVRATAGRVDTLRLGGITARNLNVVTTPALGDTDVLGMNFLSQLDSWRVEGGTLILVPRQDGRQRDPAEDRNVTARASTRR